MHVSLRTLLAYEDSLFDPATRRNWERHISSHEVACTLQRLRNVRQDAQLGVPNQDDDANIVAEYLDHISTPRATLELEHRCATSDTLLAEVAACHQVVTQHLSEEMVIDHSSRSRCYQTTSQTADAAPPSPAASSQHDSDVRRCLQRQRQKQLIFTWFIAASALFLCCAIVASLVLGTTPTQDDTPIVAIEAPMAPTLPVANLTAPVSLNSFVHDTLTPPPPEPQPHRRDNPLRVSDAIMAVSPTHAMQGTTSTGQSQ